MLFPSVLHPPVAGEDEGRYEAWRGALGRLRGDLAAGRSLGVHEVGPYLEGIAPGDRFEVWQDLVADQLSALWRRGRGPLLEDYRGAYEREFPRLAGPTGMPATLVEDELCARCQLPYGDAPGPESYLRRFPRRLDVGSMVQRRYRGSGRFVKLGRLGAGAWAEVWEALDRRLGRLVALKELAERGIASEADRGRLIAEARLTAALEHPAIVAVYDLPELDAGRPFYVMRRVEGSTLHQLLRQLHEPDTPLAGRTRRRRLRRLLEAIVQIAEGVSRAHAAGVVHRDLKPANVVIGAGGEAVILDWGLAERRDSTPSAEPGSAAPPGAPIAAGTPEYMAPEQVDGIADERTDIFGLGATLYQVLTGHAPRDWAANGRPEEWRDRVRAAPITPPRRRCPGVPRRLDAICRKALAPAPAARYASAERFAADLRRYLAGEPVEAGRERDWRRWLSLFPQAPAG